MAKGRLDEDTINFILTAESSQLQQEIQKSSKVIKDLEEREKELRKQQAAVKAALGESSKEYKAATKAIKDTTQAIDKEKQKLQEMSKQLGVNSMSMQQLRKEAKYLRHELDSTSKELEPEAWQKYAEKLREVQQRMAELKQTASGLDLSDAGGKSGGGGILDTLTGGKLGNLKSMFAAGGIIGLATAAFSKLTDMASAAISRIKDFVAEGVEMARSADGIKHAFDNLDRTDLLKGLREATHGTVTDLELMKAAVQANDFRIPLENLGKYLEFAQLKASQTGQSVDYLTNSIVTGLGRQSKMILDNLGISAAELTEKMEGGATMAEAVGQIIDKQLDEQGEHYETAAERATRATTELTNKQREIGEAFLPIAEKGQEMFTKLKVGAINLVLNIISYCTKLYDELATVRIVVETVRVAFDTAFKAIELGFDLVIDIVKGVGRAIVDLAKLVEGVFTLDYDGLKKAWADLGNHIVKNATKVVDDATDVGTRWGNNFINSIDRVVKGRKITAPKPENTLPEVTVTGKKGKQEDKKKKGGSSHDNTAKQQAEEDSKALKQFNKARQAEVDAENSSYQQRINNLKQMLVAQQLTKEQYALQEQTANVGHAAKLLAIETEYAKKAESLTLHNGEKKEEILDAQNKRVEQAQQKSFDTQLAAHKAFNDNMVKIRSMAKDTTGLTELEKLAVERDAQLKVLEGYYQASLEYAEENGLDLEDVNKSYQDAIASLNNKYRILEQRAVERAEQQNLQIRQRYGLVSQQELFDAELEQLKRHLEEKKITQEEYEDAVSSMRRDKWKESFDYYNRLFGDAVNALQDAELANVEAKYDAEIEAARKAGKDTSALENKKAQDQLKIQKKYADVNFAVKASQIIADTAVSIMKSYADLGPIAGSVAAALMGITGAAQLAAANSEREKIKKMTLNGSSSNTGAGARVATGLEDGGFLDVERRQDGKKFHAEFKPDKRGFVDRPTVIVGEGPRSKEWVASNSAVENPTVAPLLYDLDRAQKAGTIRTFDLKKWVVTKFPGLESGGSLSQQPGDGTRYPSRDGRTADVAYRDELARLVIILDRLERNGIPATVGLDQFDAQQKIRQQSRNIARKEAG
ncbi:MAG: hypothetical protein J6T43_02195 [Prevotella sp.]|nr:hypothetical protein [Prevotella sp.]